MNVFVSYAREDLAYVEQLIALLKQNGVEAWYDQHLLGGDAYLFIIDAEIVKAEAVLVLLSQSSNHSRGVLDEITRARNLGKKVIPVAINDIRDDEIPTWLSSTNYIDARRINFPIEKILAALGLTQTSSSNLDNNRIRQMQPGCLSDLDSSLIIVPDGGLISKERVGINSRQVGDHQVGILTSFPDDILMTKRVQVPVRLIPLDIVPENTLAISASLRGALGLSSISSDTWQLEYKGIYLQPAQKISFDVPIELPLEEVVKELETSQDLMGRLIWTGNQTEQSSRDSLLLEFSGRPYRISQLEPEPTGGKTVLEIIPTTGLSVFSSSSRSGVDMVILADSSGSMNTPDLTENTNETTGQSRGFLAQRGRRKSITRMDALHNALNKLLEMRLHISGRVSRIALVSFTSESKLRFPDQQKGMAEIDGASAPEMVRGFRDAIGLLRAEDGSTDIGQALHYAAELLHKHGRPGNERLIVLISDGKNWQPKDDESTGGIEGGLEDPVSLMIHLHENMDIRLHAIGISNRTIFDSWWRNNNPGKQPEDWRVPSHELLESLVEVGGNDPSRTGDTDVLEEYFSGLGKGMMRKISNPRDESLPALQAEERDIINASRNQIDREKVLSKFRQEKDLLVETINDLYFKINEFSEAAISEVILDPSIPIESISLKLGCKIIDSAAFIDFVKDLQYLVFAGPQKTSSDIIYPYTSKLVSSQVAAETKRVLQVIEKPVPVVDLGQLGIKALGKDSIAKDDIEAYNRLQLYFLRETIQVLQQIQKMLMEVIEERVNMLTDEAKMADKEPPEPDRPTFRFIE